METINIFNRQKEEVTKLLNNLLLFLNKGNELGVMIEPEYITKIEKAINDKQNEKLKVVLVGGFSEGKTSIAAAWLEEYDKNKMKIAMSESTDDIREYNIGNLHLVDTPGLFGFKETANKEKYKDITKKYISEANIILYVMNPNNSIKESHKEELEWLFKELDLLDRTIFILSRFDSVADIENENDYNKILEIKREDVLKRLNDLNIIDSSKNSDLPVVAVSANPFDEGIEYWLKNMEEFKKISHISNLQNATTKLIEKNGGMDKLILETQKSIISDILNNKIPVAKEKLIILNKEYKNISNVLRDIEIEIKNLEKNIIELKIELKNFIVNLFKDLILQLNGISIATCNDFFERNIGDKGIVLNQKISSEFEMKISMVESELARIEKNFDNEIENFKEFTEDNSLDKFKMGANFMKNAKLGISNVGIKMVRDFLNLSIKFKPWEALKIANYVNKGVPIIGATLGIGLEIWDSWNKAKQEDEFLEAKKKIKESFNIQREEYIKLLENEEEFDKKIFKNYYNLKENMSKLSAELQMKEEEKSQFELWLTEAEKISENLERYK